MTFFNGGQGITYFKASCRAATTADITLSGPQTIDAVSVVAGDRVLVKDQSTGANNGIYIVAAGAWTRATDFAQSGSVKAGLVTYVTEGTTNGNKPFWLTTDDPITLGTTALVFASVSGTMGIGNSITGATAGSVLFAGTAGVLAQDNANLFWDDTNNQLLLGSGSLTKPAFSFVGDVDSGFYRVGANEIDWVVNATSVIKVKDIGGGAQSVTLGATTIQLLVPSYALPATPQIAFTGSTSTGFNSPATSTIGVISSGTQVAQFDTTGLTVAGGTFGLGVTGRVTITPPAVAGAGTALVGTTATFTAPANTTQTASTDVPDFYFNQTRTVQKATGALAAQRAFLISAPTYSAVAATTITNAATMAIAAAPTAGTNATITNAYALWVQAGTAKFDGGVNSTTYTGSSTVTLNSDGTVSAPVITMGATADSNTGIWHPAADTMGVAVGGQEGIRVGVSAGDSYLLVNTSTLISQITADSGASSGTSGIALYGHAAQANNFQGGQFAGVRSRGTKASPTGVSTSDSLASLLGVGFTSASGFNYGGQITIRAAETFTASASGGEILFNVTPIGSNGLTALDTAERMRLTATTLTVSPSGTTSFTVGDSTADRVLITGGTLASTKYALNVTGTLPNVAAAQIGANFAVTSSAGSSPTNVSGIVVNLSGTYTGSFSYGLSATNSIATQTGTTWGGPTITTGIISEATGTGSGNASGVFARSTGSTGTGIGVFARANKASGTATSTIAVLGQAEATVSTVTNRLGGYFTLRDFATAIPTSMGSAALMADNSTSTFDILVLKDDTTTVFKVVDAGAVTAQNSTNSTTAFRVLNAAGTTTVLDVDTTNVRLGIGTAAPTSAVHVLTGTSSSMVAEVTGDASVFIQAISANTTRTSQLAVLNTSGGASGVMSARGTTASGISGSFLGIALDDTIDFKANNSSGLLFGTDDAAPLILGSNNVERLRFGTTATGELVFNDTAVDYDFRVEGSATRPNLFFIDAGQARVGINRASATLGSTLDVDNLAVAESIFIARDNGTAVFTIADGGDVAITVGTLTTLRSSFKSTSTLANPGGTDEIANQFVTTGAGSSTSTQTSLYSILNAGYTGSSSTWSAIANNLSAGTAASALSGTVKANYGVQTLVSSTTTGDNVGLYANAVGGDRSIGAVFLSQTTKTNAKNIGLFANASNTGGTFAQIGGLFTIGGSASDPVLTTSAALIADNRAQTDAIFIARDNGTAVFTIADGGAVTSTSTSFTIGGAGTMTWPSANASGVLTNNGSGTLTWSAASTAIGSTITSATAGSVLFAGAAGILAQDNTNFFWDDSNNRLGIGTSTPAYPLHITAAAGPASVRAILQDSASGASLTAAGDTGVLAYLKVYGSTNAGNYITASSPVVAQADVSSLELIGSSTSAIRSNGASAPLVIFAQDIERMRWSTVGEIHNSLLNDYDVTFNGTSANLLVLDASTNRVGIGTASPSAHLHVSGGDLVIDGSVGSVNPLSITKASSSSISGSITNSTNGAAAYSGWSASSATSAVSMMAFPSAYSSSFGGIALADVGQVNATAAGGLLLSAEHASGPMYLYAASVLHATLTNTETVLNDTGANLDFRVEGDTDANLMFVDASADFVGIGTSAPAQKLDVRGAVVGQMAVSAKTTTTSPAAADARTAYTNEGATAQVNFNLPAAAAGLEYTFVVQDTDGVIVTAAAGDTIRVAGSVSASGGTADASTIGNVLRLLAINATEWIAIAAIGTWTLT